MRSEPLTKPLTLLLTCLLYLTLPAVMLQAQAPKCPSVGRIDITGGAYSSSPGVSFQLRRFHAVLIPQSSQAPFCYQRITNVSSAVIFVSNNTLTHVFADKLGSSESSIKDFAIENSAEGVTLSGTITRLIPIHFSIFGPVMTDGTALLVHADKVKADGIPIGALLALVGQHLSSLFNVTGVSGVKVQDNTLFFLPEQLAHLKGHIASVSTSPVGLTLTYTPKAHGSHTPAAAKP